MTGGSGTATQRPPERFYDRDDSTDVCILCGEPDYSPHRDVDHFGYRFSFSRCRCGLVKQTPMPNRAFFEWFFNSDLFISAKRSDSDEIWGFFDYLADEPNRLATSKYRYRRLRPYLEAGPRLRTMKVGPSTGTFLHVAQEHGHEAIGSDVSSEFVAYARDHYGVRIDHGRFEELRYEDESFDVVLLFNVVENINNLDEFLDSVRRRLKPGGLFILNHVDMKGNLIEKLQGDKYFLYRPPICYIFEMPVLERLLAKHGFRVERTFRDLRIMNLEKIFTLLRWRLPYRIAKALRIHRVPFPVYAYPSRILVTRKSDRPPSAGETPRPGSPSGSSTTPSWSRAGPSE